MGDVAPTPVPPWVSAAFEDAGQIEDWNGVYDVPHQEAVPMQPLKNLTGTPTSDDILQWIAKNPQHPWAFEIQQLWLWYVRMYSPMWYSNSYDPKTPVDTGGERAYPKIELMSKEHAVDTTMNTYIVFMYKSEFLWKNSQLGPAEALKVDVNVDTVSLTKLHTAQPVDTSAGKYYVLARDYLRIILENLETVVPVSLTQFISVFKQSDRLRSPLISWLNGATLPQHGGKDPWIVGRYYPMFASLCGYTQPDDPTSKTISACTDIQWRILQILKEGKSGDVYAMVMVSAPLHKSMLSCYVGYTRMHYTYSTPMLDDVSRVEKLITAQLYAQVYKVDERLAYTRVLIVPSGREIDVYYTLAGMRNAVYAAMLGGVPPVTKLVWQSPRQDVHGTVENPYPYAVSSPQRISQQCDDILLGHMRWLTAVGSVYNIRFIEKDGVLQLQHAQEYKSADDFFKYCQTCYRALFQKNPPKLTDFPSMDILQLNETPKGCIRQRSRTLPMLAELQEHKNVYMPFFYHFRFRQQYAGEESAMQKELDKMNVEFKDEFKRAAYFTPDMSYEDGFRSFALTWNALSQCQYTENIPDNYVTTLAPEFLSFWIRPVDRATVHTPCVTSTLSYVDPMKDVYWKATLEFILYVYACALIASTNGATKYIHGYQMHLQRDQFIDMKHVYEHVLIKLPFIHYLYQPLDVHSWRQLTQRPPPLVMANSALATADFWDKNIQLFVRKWMPWTCPTNQAAVRQMQNTWMKKTLVTQEADMLQKKQKGGRERWNKRKRSREEEGK